MKAMLNMVSRKRQQPRVNAASLPDDILVVIAEVLYASWLPGVVQLAMVSRRMLQLLVPILYSSVLLKSNRHCREVLTYLAKHPEVARLVIRLEVTLDRDLYPFDPDKLKETVLIQTIVKMSVNLVNLQEFNWGAGMDPQMLAKQGLFLAALRASCPQLHSLGLMACELSRGEIKIPDELFAFRGLRSFSLTFQILNKGSPIDVGIATLSDLFWDFLNVNRHLLELKLCTKRRYYTLCPSKADIGPLFRLSFPNLQILALGRFAVLSPIVYGMHFPSGQGRSVHDLHRFLRLHHTLRTFRYFNEPFGDNFPFLPNLKRLAGLASLAARLHPSQAIQHFEFLTLNNTINLLPLWYLKELCTLIPNLTSFSIRIAPSSSTNPEGFWHTPASLIAGLKGHFPSLLHLEICSLTRDGLSLVCRTFSARILLAYVPSSACLFDFVAARPSEDAQSHLDHGPADSDETSCFAYISLSRIAAKSRITDF
ncbi:hypothetical protein C8J56DRAFT_1054458 [Mycena floridula]|nr:hypothetical protein C8J56DRAFT_1054458 [Mycena floridula]